MQAMLTAISIDMVAYHIDKFFNFDLTGKMENDIIMHNNYVVQDLHYKYPMLPKFCMVAANICQHIIL